MEPSLRYLFQRPLFVLNGVPIRQYVFEIKTHPRHELAELPERTWNGLQHISICRLNGKIINGYFSELKMYRRKNGRMVIMFKSA